MKSIASFVTIREELRNAIIQVDSGLGAWGAGGGKLRTAR